MKKVTRWLRSKTGLVVMISFVVLIMLLAVAGSILGWWSLPTQQMTGTAGGGPEVTLDSFTAAGERGRAVLRWQTSAERNCQGFYLYRAVSGTDAFVQINSSVIPGKPPAGGSYRFNEMTITAGSTYDYRLFAVGQQGQLVLLRTVTVELP